MEANKKTFLWKPTKNVSKEAYKKTFLKLTKNVSMEGNKKTFLWKPTKKRFYGSLQENVSMEALKKHL